MHQTVGDWCSGSTPDFDSVSISSILISPARNAVVALVVERILGKDEVVSSNLINSTIQCPAGQIGKVISLKRRSSPCSNQGQGTTHLKLT